MVQGVIERSQGIGGHTLSLSRRAVVATVILAMGAMAGTLGIVPLIARGYSTMAVACACVYALPLCTLGVYKLLKFQQEGSQ